MYDWHGRAAMHSLRHKLADGFFVREACAYCGLSTIDFCPECGIFVCRRCDVRRHWPAAGIFPDIGLAGETTAAGEGGEGRNEL